MKRILTHTLAAAMIAVTALAGIDAAQGQSRPTVEMGMVNYDYAPTVASKGTESPTEIMTVATYFGLSFPMAFNGDRTQLQHTITYRHLDKDYRNWPFADDSQEYIVHSNTYTYRLDATHRVNERLQISASIAPEVKSNLEHSLAGNYYYVSGSALVVRSLNEHVSAGIGAGYSRLFGRALPYPMVAVEWNPSAKVAARVLLPETAKFRWTPLNFLDLTTRARLDGDVFTGNTAETYGMDDARVGFTNATVGQSVEVRLADWVSLSAEGGFTLYRQLRVDNAAGESAKFDPARGQYIRMGIRIGFD